MLLRVYECDSPSCGDGQKPYHMCRKLLARQEGSFTEVHFARFTTIYSSITRKRVEVILLIFFQLFRVQMHVGNVFLKFSYCITYDLALFALEYLVNFCFLACFCWHLIPVAIQERTRQSWVGIGGVVLLMSFVWEKHVNITLHS